MRMASHSKPSWRHLSQHRGPVASPQQCQLQGTRKILESLESVTFSSKGHRGKVSLVFLVYLMVSELKIDLLKVQLHLGCSSSVIICIGKSGVIHCSFMPTPWHQQQQGNVASFLTQNFDVSSPKCNRRLLQGFMSLVCLYLGEGKFLTQAKPAVKAEQFALTLPFPEVSAAAWFAVLWGRGTPSTSWCARPQKRAGAGGTPSQGLLLTPTSRGCTLCHLAWKYL